MDPGLASAWMHKGNVLDFSGRHKEALACFDKALEIDPHYLILAVSINRAGCFYSMGRYRAAIACLDKVLNIINSEKMPKLLELLILNERERLLSQIPYYKNLIYGLKGMCLYELGKHEEALRCFDKGLEIDPNNTNAWFQKGNVLVKLGKYDGAINAYQELLNIRPDGWLDVWLRKGASHDLLVNNKEAVECYDRVLEINSSYAEVWFLKGQALIKLGRSDAQYCLDKAKKLGYNGSSVKKN
jgi:tetratricopeptide (TPR) repeat protein